MATLAKDPSKHKLLEIFNNNCRYLDDILTVNNTKFLDYAKQIYPKELTLYKANMSIFRFGYYTCSG